MYSILIKKIHVLILQPWGHCHVFFKLRNFTEIEEHLVICLLSSLQADPGRDAGGGGVWDGGEGRGKGNQWKERTADGRRENAQRYVSSLSSPPVPAC